jgi:hypothetical protein
MKQAVGRHLQACASNAILAPRKLYVQCAQLSSEYFSVECDPFGSDLAAALILNHLMHLVTKLIVKPAATQTRAARGSNKHERSPG